MLSGVKLLRKVVAGVVRNIAGTITHVITEEPIVALTFDDGPHPVYTHRLLSILGRYRAHATFFMVGLNAEEYPNLVREASMAGHAIGNHSWDHPSFPLISGRERQMQIRACSRAIAPYGQRLFRPPYGDLNAASRLNALWAGYQVVTWNILAEDWLDHDADWMANWMLERIRPGSIILLHDALYHNIEERYADREQMLKALEILLQQVGNHFHFITIPELLKHGRPQLKNWQQNPDINFLNALRGQHGKARQYEHRYE